MIPQLLTLKNFLSYREATLDFHGLHVACICGANGAGKSSLLEAIAWVVWGQSRAASEDDVIHLGMTETQVDFVFQCHQQTYRIIRSRYRGQSSSLEFQIQTPTGFRALTERGMRATQQLILQHLKLDYETFINSAYLRQGRADEFMLKRPGERKQILADLLKLDQYDTLAEQAKERVRLVKAELTVLERNLETLETQLQQGGGLAAEQETVAQRIAQMQTQQAIATERLQQFQASQHQRHTWQQQMIWQQQQQQHLNQDCQRLQQEWVAMQQRQQELEAILQNGDAIAQGFAQFQALQAEEEEQTAKFQAHQQAQAQRQQAQQQHSEALNDLKHQVRRVQAQLESLDQQEQDIQRTLNKAGDIATALEQLHQARASLTALDQLQMQAAPLMQRRQNLQSQLDRAQTRLVARLEEVQTTIEQLQGQQDQHPKLQQAVLEVTDRIAYLEARREYQQQVREKGVERRNFMERLQERQREYELQLAELDHKIQMLRKGATPAVEGDSLLSQNGAVEALAPQIIASPLHLFTPSALSEPSEGIAPYSSQASTPAYPPCPLCDRPLDEHHWQLVLERHLQEQQDIQSQLWVIREQLAVSDQEIQLLRQEYRALERELNQFSRVLERKGKLQEQIQGTVEVQHRLHQLQEEQQTLARSLDAEAYAADLQEEMRLLDRRLQELNYDDKNHALARGQVDRWRWAEIKQAEVKQAQRLQAQIAERRPILEAQLADLQHQLAAHSTSPLQQQMDALDRQIAEIGYSLEHHTHLRQALRQAQPWQLRYQQFLQAQQQYPQVQQRSQEMAHLVADRTQALQAMSADIQTLGQQLQQTPDHRVALQSLEREMQQRRAQLDDHLAQLGRLQQQQQQLAYCKQQQTEQLHQLQQLRRQYRIYQELMQAFGKNGIQALMIENVLPQLEAETNHILGRLSANQLHVQFVTQRAGRGRSRNSDKLIDTLDILIADARGTRPYETYSGGEAFRINFAIRLALARLLAQRSGAALQMLIIDEGFGTQDEAGCERLIAAIQAIASDFACILTVTHMPHFKQAFQTRIEVCKTQDGSQVCLSI